MAKFNINDYSERSPTESHGITEEWRTGSNNQPTSFIHSALFFFFFCWNGNIFTRLKNQNYVEKYAVKKISHT